MAEKGLDASQVQGSGRDGRITKEDVANASPAKPAAAAKEAAPSVDAPRVAGTVK